MSARVPQPRPVGGEADFVLAELEQHARTTRNDRRALKVALTAAVAFHVALLAVRLPADDVPPPPEQPTVVTPEVIDVVLRQQEPPRTPVDPPPPDTERIQIHFPVPEIFTPTVEALPETTVAVEELGEFTVAPPVVVTPTPVNEEPRRPWEIGVDPPVKVFNVDPVYPRMAQQVGVPGVVVLDAVIGRDGIVHEVTVLRPGVLGMTEAAVAAVRQWRYEPTHLNGRPVEVVVTVTVTFQIERP